MPRNPYVAEWHDRIVPGPVEDSPQETARYAVGANGWDTGDAPYNDYVGYHVPHRLGIGETVDAQRVDQYPVRSQIPDAAHPKGYWDRLDADEKHRESTTYTDADGWESQRARRPVGVDPRWNPPAPSRVTDKLSPSNYRFFRPFDQLNKTWPDMQVGSARRFNGAHFSMADHRRTYDVVGYMPVRKSRNTYRFDPAPWDSSMGDMPPQTYAPEQQRYRDVDVPGNPRAHRLG